MNVRSIIAYYKLVVNEIFEKLQTEVTIRGMSPGTYSTYKRATDLFLNWADKPYVELEEMDLDVF